MKWIGVTINTVTAAEELVSSAVLSCGVTGVQIEDRLPPTDKEMEAMFNDLLPETAPEGISETDKTAKVIFYLRISDSDDREPDDISGIKDDSYSINDRIYSEDEVRSVLESISQKLKDISQYTDIGPGSIELSVTSDSDWIDNWKQYYEPVHIEDVLILPEWMSVPDEYRSSYEKGTLKVVMLNPGTAFGTGSHETTKLALEGLFKYMKNGDRVLDIGTGSGIIGLCALSKGASEVIATEIDSGCIPSVMHNMEINNTDENRFKLEIANLLDPACTFSPDTFDIITANILYPVISALASSGNADRFAKRGCIFVTSGLAASREKDILKDFSFNPSWRVMEVLRMNDWISVIAQKV